MLPRVPSQPALGEHQPALGEPVDLEPMEVHQPALGEPADQGPMEIQPEAPPLVRMDSPGCLAPHGGGVLADTLPLLPLHEEHD